MVTKKILAAFISSILSGYLYGQSVKGIVYRGSSDTVVANAVVYYSGSMTGGTLSNDRGKFELKTKPVQVPIVASCIGYYSSTVYYKTDEPLIIRLKPKLEILREVTIRADGMKRENEIALFKEEFIGTSSYARSCNIVNIDDVDLRYNKKTRTLTASCDKPIIIENKKLGYTISYYLDKFEKKPTTTSIAGSYTFSDNVLPSDKNFEEIRNNREDVYNGSRMQFIRALWHHTLNNTVFKLYTPFYDELTQENIVVQDQSQQKYVHLNSRIYVVNINDQSQDNPLEQHEKYTFIDRDGFFGNGLVWSGMMGIQRIGDLLPFEFESVSDLTFKQPVVANSVKVLDQTKEKEDFADNIPHSKNLTPTEKNAWILKKMILTPVSPINNTLIVKKWQKPIRYKVYGTTGNKTYDEEIYYDLKKLFTLLTANANFSMEEAVSDSAVNLSILIGKLQNLKNHISAEAMDYFSRDVDRSGYFSYSNDGFQNMVQLINTDKTINGQNIKDAELIWPQLKAQLMAGLGFFGQLGYVKQNEVSVFNRNFNWSPDMGFKPLDKYLINSLYHPLIKSGMNESELNSAIKAMNL